MNLTIEPTKQGARALEAQRNKSCDHRDNDYRRPGNVTIGFSLSKFGHHGFYNQDFNYCLECATQVLGLKNVRLKGVDPENPLTDGGKDDADLPLSRLTEKNTVTVYWSEDDRLHALGPAREKLAKAFRVKVERPKWGDKFQRILERTSLAGWVDGAELTALGEARLEECAMNQTALWYSLKKALLAAASGRDESRGSLEGTASGQDQLRKLLNRSVHLKGSPEIGVVLQRLAAVPLVTFVPDQSESLDALGNLGWGRFARVQVEKLPGAPGPLKFTLVSGTMKLYDHPYVLRGEGGDARLWIEVGFAPALESIPPPIASRRRRASESVDDDDDGGDGNPGNWPSTTGNPSGGGRGNNPSR